jgi:hypothetical protein
MALQHLLSAFHHFFPSLCLLLVIGPAKVRQLHPTNTSLATRFEFEDSPKHH